MKRIFSLLLALGLAFSGLQSASAANSGNLLACLYFDDLAARVSGDVLTLQSNVRQNSNTCSLYTPSDNTYQPVYSIPALGITCTGPALMTYSTQWGQPIGTLMCSGKVTKFGTTVDYLVATNDGRSASWAFSHDIIVDPNAEAKAAAAKAIADAAIAKAAADAAAAKAIADAAIAKAAAELKAKQDADAKSAADKAAADKVDSDKVIAAANAATVAAIDSTDAALGAAEAAERSANIAQNSVDLVAALSENIDIYISELKSQIASLERLISRIKTKMGII